MSSILFRFSKKFRILRIARDFMDEQTNKRLAEVRLEFNLSKKDFAESLGVSGTVISDIENGKREPSKELLLTAAQKYAVSLNWLYLGVGEKRLTKTISEPPTDHPILQSLEHWISKKTGPYSIAITQINERLTRIEEQMSNAVEKDIN
jgi:transcriptional regulator with XRE-family HTH domain